MTNQRDAAEAVALPDGCPTCGALPCDWATGSLSPLNPGMAVEAVTNAMREDPFWDDVPELGTTQHDQRLEHYARIALDALASLPAASEGESSEERRHVEMQRLQEIADGAYGDGPKTRGAARDQLAAMTAASEGEPVAWRCFHCGETFTDEACARLHFGRDERSEAACVIKAGAEGSLLKALRDAEYQADDAIQRMHDESTDAAKAYHQQRCRHTQALIAAEELGYERGLADGRAAPSDQEKLAQQMADALTAISRALSGRVHSRDAIAALAAGDAAYDAFTRARQIGGRG